MTVTIDYRFDARNSVSSRSPGKFPITLQLEGFMATFYGSSVTVVSDYVVFFCKIALTQMRETSERVLMFKNKHLVSCLVLISIFRIEIKRT